MGNVRSPSDVVRPSAMVFTLTDGIISPAASERAEGVVSSFRFAGNDPDARREFRGGNCSTAQQPPAADRGKNHIQIRDILQ